MSRRLAGINFALQSSGVELIKRVRDAYPRYPFLAPALPTRLKFTIPSQSWAAVYSFRSVVGRLRYKYISTNTRLDHALPSQEPLDETGVFGMCCKHGCLLRMLNIYTGERETHAFSLLDALNDESGEASQFRVCYDLACRLSPAVQVL